MSADGSPQMEITNLPETMSLEMAARYASAEMKCEYTAQDLLGFALEPRKFKGDGSFDEAPWKGITLSLRFFNQVWLLAWDKRPHEAFPCNVLAPGNSTYTSAREIPLDVSPAGAGTAIIENSYQKSRGSSWNSDAPGVVLVKKGDLIYSVMHDGSPNAKHMTASEIFDLAELVVRSDNLASFLESRKALVAKDTPVNAAPSGSPESKESKATDATPTSWIEQVRAIALEYIAKHKANDLFPSQKDVCRHVESVARKQKIYGPQGKPISESYIQRNAIQGDWWQKNKP